MHRNGQASQVEPSQINDSPPGAPASAEPCLPSAMGSPEGGSVASRPRLMVGVDGASNTARAPTHAESSCLPCDIIAAERKKGDGALEWGVGSPAGTVYMQ